MRQLMAILTILLLTAGMARSGQLESDKSIANYFASNQLAAKNFFDTENMVDDMQEAPLTGDIYEFDAKSTKRAFFYSLLIPGAGQYYAGSRVKPFVYLGVEALIWTGYFVYHGKGNTEKNKYREYADSLYSWQEFMLWWNSLNEAQQDSFSHRLPWDEINNTVIRNHEYYENIGKYDQFQIGWDDIFDPYTGIPSTAILSPHRLTYLDMRKTANDYYQNANTMIMLSLGNRIISAFEAALTAKKYNKGQKRFSFELKTKDYGNGNVPMVTWNYRF